VVGKEMKSQITVNLLVTSVPMCNISNVKPIGLKQLQFPNIGASGRPPDAARVVHYKTDELLVQQNSIPDGQTSPVYERSQHPQYLCCFISPMIDDSTRGVL
jgi:hypothetical protein